MKEEKWRIIAVLVEGGAILNHFLKVIAFELGEWLYIISSRIETLVTIWAHTSIAVSNLKYV